MQLGVGGTVGDREEGLCLSQSGRGGQQEDNPLPEDEDDPVLKKGDRLRAGNGVHEWIFFFRVKKKNAGEAAHSFSQQDSRRSATMNAISRA